MYNKQQLNQLSYLKFTFCAVLLLYQEQTFNTKLVKKYYNKTYFKKESNQALKA